MNAADLIIGILKKEGVEYLPAFPHSDLIDAAARAGIRPIIVRQERHALHMADGYARMNAGRKLCATTAQYGPGSENAIGAVAQCYADNVPLLHIPGGYARAEQGVAPNINVTRTLQGISKSSEFVYQPERIVQMMQNAFALLRNGRPGPVVLEVPVDIFTSEVNPRLLEDYRPQRRSPSVANAEEIEFLVDALLNAQNPVIVAGQGILYAQASAALTELAELSRTPLISTLNGKSCFAENHPLALGCAGGARPDAVIHYLEQADLILGLGTSFTHSDYITPLPTRGKRLLQLTNWEGDISKDYPIEHGVIGDARLSIEAMNAMIASRGRIEARDQLAAEVASRRQAFQAEWQGLLHSAETPINPYRVIHEVMQAVDRERTMVTHEAGSPRDQLSPFWETLAPHGYIGWGKTTQLGMSLGLIQGAKLARPDWNAINFMGDAAIGMTAMDFETAVRNRIGTTTIVFKNSVMGGYTDYHPDAAAKHQIECLGGDYADLAHSLGGHAERVTAPDEILPALERALAQNADGVPALLECITSEEKRFARKLPSGL
ncbi:MAG: thiamine pyrophosphate-requiring protein [Gammaproteobacteria bacterium]|nr:thiamine pyrophosphate-requiring protein [Gammaproteobacteria bacterium]